MADWFSGSDYGRLAFKHKEKEEPSNRTRRHPRSADPGSGHQLDGEALK
jgi:hypothetical protein